MTGSVAMYWVGVAISRIVTLFLLPIGNYFWRYVFLIGFMPKTKKKRSRSIILFLPILSDNHPNNMEPGIIPINDAANNKPYWAVVKEICLYITVTANDIAFKS